MHITRNQTSVRNGAVGTELASLANPAPYPLRFAEGRFLESPDGRTLAGLHPRKTTQAITRGDYLHKQNSFLVHGEQAYPESGWPNSTRSFQFAIGRVEPMKAFPLSLWHRQMLGFERHESRPNNGQTGYPAFQAPHSRH